MTAPRGIVLSSAVAGASFVYYFASVRLRHAQYDTYAFDLGLLTQVTWNTLHGRWFETTVLPFNLLAEHLSPALVLAAPLLLVWPSADALLALQSFGIALAGVGVYLVARQRSGDPWAALLVQIAYAIVPATGWIARDEFHPITLAMPALTFATWFLWRRRFGVAALVGGLALLANEDAALVVAPFGALLAAIAGGRRRLWGVVLAALAVLWLGLYLFVIAPGFRAPELASAPHHNFRHYLQCGSALADIVGCLLDPVGVWRRSTTPGDLSAIASLLAPTLGLAAAGPSFLVALPRWAALLLGNDPPPFQLHYAALLVTAAYLAVAEALGLFARISFSMPRLVGGAIAASAAIAFVLGGPLPGGGGYRSPTEETQQRHRLVDQAIGLVPTDPRVTVATTNSMVPHLALREVVVFPVESRCPDPDVYAVDLRDGYPYTEAVIRRAFAPVRVDGAYRTVFDQEDVVVLEWVGQPRATIRDDAFGGIVRLQGVRRTSGSGPLGLELLWKKDGPARADYHYFVHLVDSAGAIFSQADGQLRGAPLGSFIDRCQARERVSLEAPPSAQWDGYSLRLGWYDFEGGARLLLPDGRDHVEIMLRSLAAPG